MNSIPTDFVRITSNGIFKYVLNYVDNGGIMCIKKSSGSCELLGKKLDSISTRFN